VAGTDGLDAGCDPDHTGHLCLGLCVDDMMHKRDRMARRADKWWRSVWHVQMCMSVHGLSMGPKPLTDGADDAKFIGLKRNTKRYVGRSDRSNQQEM